MSFTSRHLPVRGQPQTAGARLGSLAVAAVLALSLLASATAAAAQDPALYQSARAELAAGDTVAALNLLRKLTNASPDFAPGWGLLGSVLTELASGVATEFRERLEAEKAIRRALELDPGNPAYLMVSGSLKRKQQMYLDARRMLNRAAGAVEKYPAKITSAQRAQLWFQLGLFSEDVYFDTRDLMFVPNLPVNAPECAGLGAFCLNFTRPKAFNEHFRHAASLTEEGEDDLQRTLAAFRRALDADPAHDGAFRRLAVHLVELGEHGEAEIVAQNFQSAAPQDPWGYLTLGLVYQRTGRDSLAEAQFDRGLALAAPDIVEHYRDISPLLRESLADEYSKANELTRRRLEGTLWRKSDPLYLSAGNEVRVAHLARVSFADLWFEDPSSRSWGADTERGQIYVRYGPPERIWQVRRDEGRVMSDQDMAEAFAVMEGAEPISRSATSAKAGGRWIFWNYGWDLPSFIFEKQLRHRRARHMSSSASKQMEEEARAAQPAAFSTSFDLHDYPVQIARFRGAVDSIVEVDLYSEVPGEKLLEQPDTLEFGVFVFGGVEYAELYRRTFESAITPSPSALTYSLPLGRGRYTVSVEARARDGSAAVRRSEIEVEPYWDGRLALSDLVLATAVTPKAEAPADRRDFAIRVNRSGVFDPDLSVTVYWEVYGLATDEEGFADYRVELSVTDAEGKGVLARVARAFGFGDDQRIELTYDRLVVFNGARVPEYLSLDLFDSKPGRYRLGIRVADRNADTIASAEREFQLIRQD